VKNPWLVLMLSLAPGAQAQHDPVRVEVLPKTPLIETSRNGQLLNFDFLLKSTSPEPLELTAIELSVLGPGDTLVLQRRLGTNGSSILTVPDRSLQSGKRLVVFNPFHSFPPDVELKTLRYELVFNTPEKEDVMARARIDVHPAPYPGKTRLVLPATGRLLVHDGHDFTSHHRRLDITGGMTTALGITSNFGRYAYDFCVVDEKGRLFRGTGERNEDWFGFGTPIVAPGNGRVAAMANDRPDNTHGKKAPMEREAILKNPRLLFGNYVVIDHENGEFSVLAHLRKGSVTAREGQRVRRGQKIGEMGFSGDASLVHLHYQVQSDSSFGEGLPSTFESFRRVLGTKTVVVRRGQVDSGDVVESVAKD